MLRWCGSGSCGISRQKDAIGPPGAAAASVGGAPNRSHTATVRDSWGPNHAEAEAENPEEEDPEPEVAAHGPQPLWREAAVLVKETQHPLDRGDDSKEAAEKEVLLRSAALRDALEANPSAAQHVFQSFAARAMHGIEVGLPQHDFSAPFLNGLLLLRKDMDMLKLIMGSRKKRIAFVNIYRIYVWEPPSEDKTRRVWVAFVYLEFDTGECVLLALKSEVERDELALCFLILVDVFRERTLRLVRDFRDCY